MCDKKRLDKRSAKGLPPSGHLLPTSYHGCLRRPSLARWCLLRSPPCGRSSPLSVHTTIVRRLYPVPSRLRLVACPLNGSISVSDCVIYAPERGNRRSQQKEAASHQPVCGETAGLLPGER